MAPIITPDPGQPASLPDNVSRTMYGRISLVLGICFWIIVILFFNLGPNFSILGLVGAFFFVVAFSTVVFGHLGLGKLIALYDDNHISIDGSTDLSFTEDVGKRYEAYGWHVLVVKDGNTDLDEIHKAIETAKSVTDKPTLIKVRTTIGYGSPNKADRPRGARSSPQFRRDAPRPGHRPIRCFPSQSSIASSASPAS